jgi:hypothetical protein
LHLINLQLWLAHKIKENLYFWSDAQSLVDRLLALSLALAENDANGQYRRINIFMINMNHFMKGDVRTLI